MTEKLFQFIWQFRYFNSENLTTTEGEPLQIISPGTHNTSQGPDFLNAQIRCGETVLAGSIELHIRASEWIQHGHSGDKNYDNCILHVVWENDKLLPVKMPVLELKNRISNIFLSKYEMMMSSRQFIACHESIASTDELVFTSWKHRLATERLQQKANTILAQLETDNYHWEQVFRVHLARNFGMPVNADAFEKLAQSLPVKILDKHRHQLIAVEAMLMGQANLLDETLTDPYAVMLRKEYSFLKKKYNLVPLSEPFHFLRMRPANFPTVRIAQLAAIICERTSLFSFVKDARDLKSLRALFDVTANDFWHYHYTFQDKSVYKQKHVGVSMADHIIINTVLPMLFAFAHYHNIPEMKERSINMLLMIPHENNSIINRFASIGAVSKHALDSQALLQLKKKYCDEKRCLQCAVGYRMLKGK